MYSVGEEITYGRFLTQIFRSAVWGFGKQNQKYKDPNLKR